MSFGDRFLQSVMGNAVRIQNEISKVVKPETNGCTACNGAFNVLHNRKRQCGECREYFCTNCLIRIPAASGQSDRRLCNRCRIFGSNFSWDDLMLLKARDLKWFLDRRHVRTDGLKEKEQLADMIMFCFGSDRYYQDQARRQQRVAMMTSNMQEEFPTTSAQTNRASSPTSQNDVESRRADPDEAGDHEEIRRDLDSAVPPPPPYSAEDSQAESLQSEFSSQPDRPSPVTQSERHSPVNQSERHSPVNQSDRPSPVNQSERHSPVNQSERSNHLSEPSDPVQPAPVRSRPDMVHLIDFKTCAEVETLSVKQLKVLLTANHVDYRGCCEKSELVAKAKRLVSSHLENVKKLAAMNAAEEETGNGGAEDDLEDDMCKICMDALIDCVLLECGHMVTCLDCGKRMAECPICRQYVVRAVRIFKA